MHRRFPLIALGLVLMGFVNLFAASNSFSTLTISSPVSNNVNFNFGTSVAALGDDRLLVYAAAGSAYLFDLNGAVLTTFTAGASSFSGPVATLGNDRVLIAANMFTTNGALVNTFTNPAPRPYDYFGWAVAAVGNDRVLIGAIQQATGPGIAHLFHTNGTLLTTFTNPTPANVDYFGYSVAALGNDRVLIGTPNDDTGAGDAGAAYLFGTNGVLLHSFFNPTPANTGLFGDSVATIGNDYVLISSPRSDTGAIDAGQVYLLTTNGILITSFTNPTPATSDYFGWRVAALANDKVIISTHLNDTGATDSGAAYLFSTNGTLLNTFTNPAPEDNGHFGYAVAAAGNNRVLVGAPYNGGGAFNGPGAAYLFTMDSPIGPTLSAQELTEGNVRIFWPLPADGFVLDEASALASPPASISWTLVPVASYYTNATRISITNTPVGNKFYRLRKP